MVDKKNILRFDKANASFTNFRFTHNQIKFYFTGNTFIVNVALADLLITSILMPCSTIVLLAGMEEPLSACRVQWFFAACAFIITVLSLAVSI